MIRKVVFIFVFLVIYGNVLAQVVLDGEQCVIKGSRNHGICREITKCQSAREQAKKGIDQTLCGFTDDLITAIVCCEDPIEANDNLFPPNYNSNGVGSDSVSVRKSEKKCEEYNRPVTSVVQVLPLVSDASPISVSTPKCDYNSIPLIVGGEPAEAGEFPFMAAIGFNSTVDRWRCGGTLISDRFVITAAHCTFTRDAGQPTLVRLGELDLSSDQDGSEHKDYPISRVIVHPGYSSPYKYNDIALLETRSKVTFTNFIRPACLNTNNNILNIQAVATGWGRTDVVGDNSDKLMKVTLNIYNNQICQQVFASNTRELPRGIISSMVCAGELEGKKDTCYGDSGGPLVMTKKGNMCQFYLLGVTSFGKLCGLPRTAAIYTKIAEYIPWIEQIVW